MENTLDQYLEMSDRMSNNTHSDRHEIYQSANEVSSRMDEIQRIVDEVNAKINENTNGGVGENLKNVTYSEQQGRETYSFDKNEFTSILNSYYNSLRSIQFMEHNLMTKIMEIEEDIDSKRENRKVSF